MTRLLGTFFIIVYYEKQNNIAMVGIGLARDVNEHTIHDRIMTTISYYRECYLCEVTESEYWCPNKGTDLFLCRKCYRRYIITDKEKQYKKTAAEKERNWECYACGIRKSRDWYRNPPTSLGLCSKCPKHYFRNKEKDHAYKVKKYRGSPDQQVTTLKQMLQYINIYARL